MSHVILESILIFKQFFCNATQFVSSPWDIGSVSDIKGPEMWLISKFQTSKL